MGPGYVIFQGSEYLVANEAPDPFLGPFLDVDRGHGHAVELGAVKLPLLAVFNRRLFDALPGTLWTMKWCVELPFLEVCRPEMLPFVQQMFIAQETSV